jgi:N6-L-threonylcarbamoyladenine synthase
VCASFQRTVVSALVEGICEAVVETGVRDVAIVGGVSANRELRASAQEAAAANGFRVFVPELRFSVDNAAMIAVTAAHKWAAGQEDGLDLAAAPSLAL